MKNTRKLLIILCAVTVLAAMMFSLTVSAADSNTVQSGQGTTLEEYLEMKKIVAHGFENGLTNAIFGGLANRDKLPGLYQSYAGKVHTSDNVWQSAEPVYGSDESTSNKFYVIDYNYNAESGADLYVQPKLGDLNNVEKTPIYGFVAEFDLAFLSPKVPVYETDSTGKFVYADIDGNKYYHDAEADKFYDETGKEVQRDDNGILVIPTEDGKTKNVQIAQQIKEYYKGDYKGLTSNFSVGMYNTHTYKDGCTNLFVIDAATEEIKVKFYDPKTNKVMDTVAYTAKPDEWIHFAIRYDADTMLTYIYVGNDDTVHSDGSIGRKLISTMNAIDHPENYGYESTAVYPIQFRLGCSSKAGTVGLDNFLSYQGTSIHNPDYVSKYTDANLFAFLATILDNTDGNNTATNSFQAYSYMQDSIASYYDINSGSYLISNNAIKAAVETFLKYHDNVDGAMDALKEKVKLENTEKFLYYVGNVTAVTRTLDNVLERDIKITAAQKFLSSVGAFITKNSDFDEAYTSLNESAAYIDVDENANNFISYMELFNQSLNYGASLNRLTAHYEKAKACYDAGIADYDDFYGVDDASYNALKSAVDSFLGSGSKLGADGLIAESTRENNSERFVNIVNLMKNNTSGSWANDGTLIKNYWKMALDILLDENYNPNYDGIVDAKAIFNSANDFFWNELQGEHIAVLTEKLAEFNEGGKSYVEKAAVCTFVDKYVAENERYMDTESNEVKALVATNEAYKIQLGTIESDYANVLVQNTIKFVNLMQYVELFESYEDLKPLYDEATDYYYSMNITSDTISEDTIALYVAKYENLRSWIISTEADCEIFLAYSKTLESIENDDDLYFALSECYACLDFLDETYAGVADAKVIYDGVYAEYVGAAALINSQVEETANVTCALRGNWDFDSIVSYFKSLFN